MQAYRGPFQISVSSHGGFDVAVSGHLYNLPQRKIKVMIIGIAFSTLSGIALAFKHTRRCRYFLALLVFVATY